MSLTESFFDERSSVLDKYKNEGYISLEDFEEKFAIKIDKIFEQGYLTQRAIQSTTDLYDYHVSSKGRKFMKEIKRLELILVKPNSASILADVIKE